MSLDPAVRDALLLLALVLAALAFVFALVALLRLRSMRKAYEVLQAGDDRVSFVDAVARKTAEVEALRRDVGQLSGVLDRTRVELADAIRHVSVVRYDAFGDMGGRLSFSAALLDDSGDGLVLTSIHGRTETRSYMKAVTAGRSEAALSPEEEEAVAAARKGAP